MYLREMGTVPLLTRDGEVEIAKRIERGQLTVLKSLSRSPVIVREIIAIGEGLKKDPSIIKDVIQFTDEELTDEKVEEKLEGTLNKIDLVAKTSKKSGALKLKLDGIAKTAKAPHRKARWNLGRTRVELSRQVRSIEFSNGEKQRLMDLMRATVESIRPLQREMAKLEVKAEKSKKDAKLAIQKDILVIKKKINDHCDQLAAGNSGSQ